MAERVDVDTVEAEAFGLCDELGPVRGEPHHHAYHQLLHASCGVLELRTSGASAFLPPLRAAWIPARTVHEVHVRARASLRTVYLAEPLVPAAPAELRVFDVGPLARELILEAMRWGPRAPPGDTRSKLFAALGALVPEWAAVPLALSLPAAQSPELAQVLEEILSDVAEDLDMAAVAGRAGLSERTLLRRFEAELGMGFRDYVRTARITQAAELLGRRGARVKEVAREVGFTSEAAFTRAFTALMKERPSDYLARLERR